MWCMQVGQSIRTDLHCMQTGVSCQPTAAHTGGQEIIQNTHANPAPCKLRQLLQWLQLEHVDVQAKASILRVYCIACQKCSARPGWFCAGEAGTAVCASSGGVFPTVKGKDSSSNSSNSISSSNIIISSSVWQLCRGVVSDCRAMLNARDADWLEHMRLQAQRAASFAASDVQHAALHASSVLLLAAGISIPLNAAVGVLAGAHGCGGCSNAAAAQLLPSTRAPPAAVQCQQQRASDAVPAATTPEATLRHTPTAGDVAERVAGSKR